MNHEQAVQEMATERYLLDELSPELRDAFEEHMFDCAECALDVRAGNVFMTEAKVQLPEIAARAAVQAPVRPAPARAKKSWWSVFTSPVFGPAFAAPAFAALLAELHVRSLIGNQVEIWCGVAHLELGISHWLLGSFRRRSVRSINPARAAPGA